jgi:hypothetical protein
MSPLLLNLLHAAAAIAAVYIPAYVLQSTLLVTLGVYAATLAILKLVESNISGAGTLPSSGAEFLGALLVGLVPLVLMGLKYGVVGVLGFIETGIVVSLVASRI